jgi:hypothetical protein
MKYLRGFSDYKESLIYNQFNSNLMESLKTWHDMILSAIGAEFIDIKNELNLSSDLKIDSLISLSDNVEFFNSLSSLGLRKSELQRSDDFETFVNKPCRFMMIYKFDSNDLENPQYILFQSFNETLKKWEDVKLYKVKDDIKKFYDKLASKTIELQDVDQNYIYITSNGNDWELQNLDKENDTYKRFLRKEDLQSLLDNRGIRISIV